MLEEVNFISKIYVNYGKPISQTITQYSAFLSFDYDKEMIEYVKSLPNRHWVPSQRVWEIPTTLVDELEKCYEVIKINEPKEVQQGKVEIGEDVINLMKTKPLPHQVDALEFLLTKRGAINGDHQGLGKTKVSLDLCNTLKREHGIKHVLIICGVNSLKDNWLDEIEIHSNESACVLGRRWSDRANRWIDGGVQDRYNHLLSKPEEFYWITNIETLRSKKVKNRWQNQFTDLLNDYIEMGLLGVVIVDEIHKAKNPNSAQGRGLLSIDDCIKIGMSGTLQSRDPLDVYVPLRFIGAINQNYWYFAQEYTVKDHWGTVIGFKNMDKLSKILQSVMIRRLKQDVLDLPPKLPPKAEYVELSKDELSLYNNILKGLKTEEMDIEKPTQVIQRITRLRQVCCHPKLIGVDNVKSTKFERLHDILEEAKIAGEKVIVFSMFRELIELALVEYKEYEPYYMVGQMSSQQQNAMKQGFQEQDGFSVIFGQINVLGTGHTLNTASMVVFLDLPWTRADMEQAEDRAHRIGTKKPVTVISLLARNTYDELVYRLVMQRGAMSDIIVDGLPYDNYKNVLQMLFEGGEVNERVKGLYGR